MPGVTPAEVLSNFGITLVEDPADNQPRLLVDLPAAELVEYAIRREEGRMASNGALVIETGERTGRSPNDRFIVDTPDVHDKIAWGAVNRPLSIESYETIKAGIVDYLNERDVFVTRGMAGTDRNHTRRLLVACERASQALFIKQMLARPLAREIARTGEPDFCVLAAPGYQCDPAIKGLNSSAAVVINFQERVILVAGTGYSGEIKKSIFSVMNYLLPVEDDVLPMHCSASMDPVTHETAVFFGLSGTGKTTLSANPTRLLIGDDEHGWSDMGIFNIEGGCYAKCEGLDAFHEPEIFNAVRFGAICENVVLDENRKPNYDDVSITHNTRVAYPVEHIPNAWTKGMGTTPSVVLVFDLRCLWRAAAYLAPDGRCRHVSLCDGLHRQDPRHRGRRHRAHAHVLLAVWRAVYAARSHGLCQDARRAYRRRTHPRLSGQHRLDWWRLWRGPSNRACIHARPGGPRPRRYHRGQRVRARRYL